MRIAIFNSFPFHYEMFGFIIHFCKTFNHNLTIYTNKDNNLGWFDFYDKEFGKIKYRNYKKFRNVSLLIYDLVILTTDDDPKFNYKDSDKILVIDHLNKCRCPNHKNHIGTRPFKDNKIPWVLSCYPVNKCNNKDKKIIISVVGGLDNITSNNIKLITNISDKYDVEWNFVSREICKKVKELPIQKHCYENVKTGKMIKILKSTQYVLLPTLDEKKDNSISGIIPLAISMNKVLILPDHLKNVYELESAIYHENNMVNLPSNKGNVEKDRNNHINNYFSLLNSFIKPQLTIPNYIHMLWYDKNGNDVYPTKNQRFIDTWYQHNNNSTITVWNNSDVDYLFTFLDNKYQHYFDKITMNICRCDIARFLIIYLCGGLYVDLDFYCNKSIDSLIESNNRLFFMEVPEHFNRSKHLFNGIFASVKNDDFVIGWVNHIMRNCKKLDNRVDVMQTTGPQEFYKYYLTNEIELSNPCLVMPYTDKGKISKVCDEETPYCYTLWTEGTDWGKDYASNKWIYLVIIVLILVALFGIYTLL